jgi:hypothetical protein
MIYNVITPVSRPETFQSMIEMLKPKNVNWQIISTPESASNFTSNESWIYHFVCSGDLGVEYFTRAYNKMNAFFDNAEIHDDHMYCFLSDDDAVEPDFFEKIDTALAEVSNIISPSIVITSMKRGNRTPSDAVGVKKSYGTDTLVASLENMQPGKIGLEQFIIKGSLLNEKKYRIPNNVHWGDGLFLNQAFWENQEKAIFCPEANVWFNYFEPGRWDK